MLPASEVPYLTPLCVVLHEESVWIELLLLLETLMYTRTCMIPHVGTRIISHHTIQVTRHTTPTAYDRTADRFYIRFYRYVLVLRTDCATNKGELRGYTRAHCLFVLTS